MKGMIAVFLGALIWASPAGAALVTLDDGSALSGEVLEKDDGGVVVKTAAGEISVAKDKIRSIIKDGSASSGSVGSEYVNKVLERRAKYGNEDGLPRTSLIHQSQLGFTLGLLNYTGDALNFSSGGTTYLSTSDFSGLHFGLTYGRSFNDISAWEGFAGFSLGEKAFTFTTGQSAVRATVQRIDVGYLARLQKAIPMGAVEENLHFIPHIGLGPVYSYVLYSGYAVANDVLVSDFKPGSALGAALSAGADLQIGSALVGLKFRYLLSVDLSGRLNSSNLNAMLPQFSLGWAF